MRIEGNEQHKWIREFEQYKVTRRTRKHPEYINVIFNCYYLGDDKYQLIDENGYPLYFESLDEFKRFLRKHNCYIAGNTDKLRKRERMFCKTF